MVGLRPAIYIGATPEFYVYSVPGHGLRSTHANNPQHSISDQLFTNARFQLLRRRLSIVYSSVPQRRSMAGSTAALNLSN